MPNGALWRDHFLRYGTPAPRSSLWFGIYIDGVFIVQIMRRSAVKTRAASDGDVRLSEAIKIAYESTPGVTETGEKTVEH